MVQDSGRAITVRAKGSAGRIRPPTSNCTCKLRKSFRGYTQASTRPDSSPKTPARVPTAVRNSHGRSAREISSERSCADARTVQHNKVATAKFLLNPEQSKRKRRCGDESIFSERLS